MPAAGEGPRASWAGGAERPKATRTLAARSDEKYILRVSRLQDLIAR